MKLPKIELKIKWYAPGGIYITFAEHLTVCVNQLARLCGVEEINTSKNCIHKAEILNTLELIKEQIEIEFWNIPVEEGELIVPLDKLKEVLSDE